jgi:hypothetical protein
METNKNWIVVLVKVAYQLEDELNKLDSLGYDIYSVERDMGSYLLIGSKRWPHLNSNSIPLTSTDKEEG